MVRSDAGEDIVSKSVRHYLTQVGFGIKESSRGGGVLFGQDITSAFLHANSLQCLIRSHSEIKEGCITSHQGCYTVYSAPSVSRFRNCFTSVWESLGFRNILGGVLTLHPTDTNSLRLEGFVFQEVGKTVDKVEW